MMTCPLPFIRGLDYDMIVQGDLSHVLEADHELAFNLHGDEKVINSEYGRKYPISGCVQGTKTHQFAVDLRASLLEDGSDDWLGATHSFNEVAKRYRVRLLDGRTYNYTPENREDRPPEALVIHYKGMRKHWMVPPEMEARGRADEQIADKIREYKSPGVLQYDGMIIK